MTTANPRFTVAIEFRGRKMVYVVLDTARDNKLPRAGRLDCGTLDAFVLDTMRANGIETNSK